MIDKIQEITPGDPSRHLMLAHVANEVIRAVNALCQLVGDDIITITKADGNVRADFNYDKLKSKLENDFAILGEGQKKGEVLPRWNWRGNWNGAIAYKVGDVVIRQQRGDMEGDFLACGTYRCIKDIGSPAQVPKVTKNTAPIESLEYWETIAKTSYDKLNIGQSASNYVSLGAGDAGGGFAGIGIFGPSGTATLNPTEWVTAGTAGSRIINGGVVSYGSGLMTLDSIRFTGEIRTNDYGTWISAGNFNTTSMFYCGQVGGLGSGLGYKSYIEPGKLYLHTDNATGPGPHTVNLLVDDAVTSGGTRKNIQFREVSYKNASGVTETRIFACSDAY